MRILACRLRNMILSVFEQMSLTKPGSFATANLEDRCLMFRRALFSRCFQQTCFMFVYVKAVELKLGTSEGPSSRAFVREVPLLILIIILITYISLSLSIYIYIYVLLYICMYNIYIYICVTHIAFGFVSAGRPS